MTAQGAIPTTAIDHHLAFDNTAPAVSLVPLVEGAQGTWQTLNAMRDCVLGQVPPDYSGYQDEFNISAANNICARSSPGHKAQIAALFNYCAHKIQYLEHPINQQVCQDARRTIEIGSGDCVSLSVLLSTLLACLGYHSRFVAQCLDGNDYSHVYVEVLTPDGNWLALDPVARDKPMGWLQPVLDGGFSTTWMIFT